MQKGHAQGSPLWGPLLGFAHLLFNRTTKNFLILRSNYTTEVCLVLHESFVRKTGPKCNCLLISSPPVCRPRMHIRVRMRIVFYCLRLDVKLDLVIDCFA